MGRRSAMSSPRQLDLRQLRIQAKELKRALEGGDPAALDRVLASHPKFAGRPAERVEGRSFTLRDAQVTIAREHGFESWKALLLELEGEPRWDATASVKIAMRAFTEARELRHAHCSDLHFLLALLRPPSPTASAEVLQTLGLTYEKVRDSIDGMQHRKRGKWSGSGSTPMYQLILGLAQGIAIGMGASSVSDEHVLLAFTYGDPGGGSRLHMLEIDPDEVVAGLQALGVRIAGIPPPVAPTPTGPGGPWVYVPKKEWSAVTQELAKLYPPGTLHWGFNESRSKRGYWYVVGEDEIPMEEIVRSVVKDAGSVLVLPHDEGQGSESSERGRRRAPGARPRPKPERGATRPTPHGA
jgi:hypothetical protein